MKRLLLATTAVMIGGQACGADLRLPVKAPAAPVSAFSWTGCSLGVHVGAGWGRSTFSDPNSPNFLIAPPGGEIEVDQGSGALGGVHVGCDYQFASHWVAGIGGDFSWANIEGHATDPFFGGKFNAPITLTAKTDSVATATARLGYAFDRLMFYGKGGAAWSRNTYGVQNAVSWGGPFPNVCVVPSGLAFVFIACNPSGTDTRAGWTVGLGFEWAFAGNWTAGVEFDHYDFGTRTVTLTDPNVFVTPGFNSTSAPLNIRQTMDTAKVTLSYRFGWWGGP